MKDTLDENAAGKAWIGLLAKARPGRIEEITGAAPPAPLSVAAGCVLLTLCDGDTPVLPAGNADTKEVRGCLSFHTGAPLAGPAQAMFAVGKRNALRPLEAYRIG